MLLSVIVPVFNGEKTIKKCLLSIINQDYKELELIVIDDGSTDNTASIVEKLIEENPDVLIKLVSQKNVGLPQARKAGVEQSSGDYIGFVDADDWIEPQMYSTMMSRVTEYDADLVCCDMIYEFPSSRENYIQKHGNKIFTGREAITLLHDRQAIFPCCVNKVARKELYNDLVFPDGNIIGEDYAITRQLLLSAKSVYLVNYLGYHYIKYNGSMSRSGFDSNRRKSFVLFYNIVKDTYKTGDKELIASTDNYMTNEFLWVVISMVESNVYDYKILYWIKKYIRKRLSYILLNKHNSILFKVSSIMILINYNMLGKAYVFYNRIKNGL